MRLSFARAGFGATAVALGAASLVGLGVAGSAADGAAVTCGSTVTDGPDMVVAYDCDRDGGGGAADNLVTTASGTYRCEEPVYFFVSPFRELEKQGVDTGHQFIGGACSTI
ncbi:hypothetical protein ABZY44_02960 [Streptomyces sp. NPDC006544]|uniref:hypothetical protein n=1 Tax=Streptomyces sp. NPDC006544 TaxID=3154583 RepID=UPI0033A16CD5